MKYKNICWGVFKERPNRFIAKVAIDGEEKICHVKNTGRCRELLLPNSSVVLERSDDPRRKTEYDLIAVIKDGKLFNIDSQAPNKAFGEWAAVSGYFGEIKLIRPEKTFGNSRFDFYIEASDRKIFVEVKGVTLERDGVLLFPDAPTERGAKHLSELIEAKRAGYDAYIFFVIQTEECKYFTPNDNTDKVFASTLREAARCGVKVRAVTCHLSADSMEIKELTRVEL